MAVAYSAVILGLYRLARREVARALACAILLAQAKASRHLVHRICNEAALICRSIPNDLVAKIIRLANLSKACRSVIIHANLKTMCAV